MHYPREILESVLNQYGIASANIEPVKIGLINDSFRVTGTTGDYLLQRVNKMFAPRSHADIDKVTQHLLAMDMVSPRLVHTDQDKLYYQDDHGVWRLYTYIEGKSVDIVNRPETAYQAGTLLGRFHSALGRLDYEFINPRAPIHQLDRHIQHLQTTLQVQKNHDLFHQVKPLAMEILAQASLLPTLPQMRQLKVHGDPKINNFLFEPDSGNAICMVDFDTLSNMPIALELGDAMRSWCNPDGENISAGRFVMEFFEAGLSGYISTAGDFADESELTAVLPATQIIYIELASRFCADALNEDYFAWDPEQFTSHSEHSLVRSTCQLNCYRSLTENIKQAEQVVSRLIR